MGGYEDYFENFTLKNKTSDLKEDLKITIKQINKIDSQRFELTKRINDINAVIDNLATGDFFLNISQQNILPAYLNTSILRLENLYIEMDNMKLSYNEWLQQLQELNNSKSRLENAFVNMPDKNTQFNKKQRFYKLNEEIYLTLMQHKSEFEIAQAGSTPDFKLLSTATLPTVVPIAPQKAMIYGIGFVAGIVLNIFLIGILYLANDKITNADEVERLTGVPLLGIVPKHRRQTGSGIYIMDHPKSMVSEAMRTLRTNLDFFSVTQQKR
jgi:tyrosine-protein kinase Etk/Wzc